MLQEKETFLSPKAYSSLKAVSPLSVWAEPEDEGKTILNAIAAAKYSIDIVIYEIGGPKILAALQGAKKNEVDIRLLVNGQFFVGPVPEDSRYDQVYAMLEELDQAPGSGQVTFHWASNNFEITHQKTILIDTREKGCSFQKDRMPDSALGLIMTLNLSAYPWMISYAQSACIDPCQFWGPGYPNHGKGTRDFGVSIIDPSVIAKIACVFESDFNCSCRSVTNHLKDSNDGLVWSNGTTGLPGSVPGEYPKGGIYPYPFNPYEGENQGNARALHLSLIKNAKKTLVIYNEEMNDDEIVEALVEVSGKGVDIRLLLTGGINSSKCYNFESYYALLAPAGVKIRLFPCCGDYMYIHAKILLADANTEEARAFLGSQNISGVSLNYNRELGVILKGKKDTQILIDTFEKDWETKGLIEWPSDGSAPSVENDPCYQAKELSLPSATTPKHLVHYHSKHQAKPPIRTTSTKEPMACGEISPRPGGSF